MDIRGLEPPDEVRVDINALENMGPEQRSRLAFAKFDERAKEALNPLPFKTGGTFVQNRNFFTEGIGEQANNMMQGYYLLSYIPPAETFNKDGKNVYHGIKIRAKRQGAVVYTRDGFYGRTEEETSPKYRNPMQEAIFSPFLNKDLKVNLASAYLDDVNAGYVLRSWLNVDARDVTIKEKPGEGYIVKLETVCLTSDLDGRIQDARMLYYDFKIREENISWIREHGIRFSLLLPVKRPGAYYVRAAVKDVDSGKIGSAYQFIQIPDLKKNKLALSNIFVVNRQEDADWIRAGRAKDLTPNVFAPVLKRDGYRSPAMRQYNAGDNIRHMAVLYNAKRKKEKLPDLEVQSILYKDGAEFHKSEFRPLELNGVTNYDRIPITQKLILDPTLSKGDYVLELLVRDKNRKEKAGLTSQSMDFQITKE
jgi:hypothetical protein